MSEDKDLSVSMEDIKKQLIQKWKELKPMKAEIKRLKKRREYLITTVKNTVNILSSEMPILIKSELGSKKIAENEMKDITGLFQHVGEMKERASKKVQDVEMEILILKSKMKNVKDWYLANTLLDVEVSPNEKI